MCAPMRRALFEIARAKRAGEVPNFTGLGLKRRKPGPDGAPNAPSSGNPWGGGSVTPYQPTSPKTLLGG